MAKIVRYNIKYLAKIKKLLSEINGESILGCDELLLGLAGMFPSDILPLQIRHSAESFIAINDKKEVKALLTISPVDGNFRKWFIKRLFLSHNSYDEGKQLIDYVVSKFGASGADTFCVLTDESDENSAALFSRMCGFRLCSREVLWKMNEPLDLVSPIKKDNFSLFKNSDAQDVADLFNSSVFPHFRYSLECEKGEFNEKFFKGLSKNLSYKFILRDENGIFAYTELLSSDNKNWIIDLIVSKQYEDSYIDIIKTLVLMLRKRSRSINVYVKCRNYMSSAKLYEEMLSQNRFSKYDIKMLFVKDFYKPVKENEGIVNPAIILNELPNNPAFTKFNPLQK